MTESAQKLKRGDQAPDFNLRGTNGKTHSLADFGGREGLLIIFMCNHCPYVKAKIEVISELYKKYGDKIGIIGINSNDPSYPGEGMENMKAFAEDRGIEFPYVLDDTQETAKAYGATCTPDPFLFDKERKLVFHGRINDEMEPGDPVSEHTMADTIEKLLRGDPPAGGADEFKPSMGCSIKWIA